MEHQMERLKPMQTDQVMVSHWGTTWGLKIPTKSPKILTWSLDIVPYRSLLAEQALSCHRSICRRKVQTMLIW